MVNLYCSFNFPTGLLFFFFNSRGRKTMFQEWGQEALAQEHACSCGKKAKSQVVRGNGERQQVSRTWETAGKPLGGSEQSRGLNYRETTLRGGWRWTREGKGCLMQEPRLESYSQIQGQEMVTQTPELKKAHHKGRTNSTSQGSPYHSPLSCPLTLIPTCTQINNLYATRIKGDFHFWNLLKVEQNL